MISGAQFASSPEARRSVRRDATEFQRDLEKLRAAAEIHQVLLLRTLSAPLREAAGRNFRMGTPWLTEGDVPAEGLREFVERWAELLAASQALGIAQIRRSAGLAVVRVDAVFAEELEDIRPERAVEFLKKMRVLTRKQWERAIEAQRANAFTISGVAREEVLRKMRNLIARSLESGLTPAQFDRAAGQLLRNYAIEPSRLRTIWNNNVAKALAKGREEATSDPDVATVLSFGLFDAVNDSVTRENHLALDGGIAPRDWWFSVQPDLRPPLGHNCRCVLLWITRVRAERLLASGGVYRDLTVDLPAEAHRDLNFVEAAFRAHGRRAA